ncbi:SRPBCC family protein [Sphingosinicella rhizophila]|uniref:Polyketide cyclase/dehydrase/lipid transport protein n=1 Tax=Sphingosinicella rhizophila TaxID=3050082 RepID=A0ABU3Q9Y0_9SPHN|nr:hypothetical protein [Sphingosinicella sp. GR2756]MDT9599929.1 hypothetical protein [Sphingosinicella sp. GR2756]
MTEQKLIVTMVNHVAVDMAAAPDAVWKLILEEYVEAKKFQEGGYSIESIDDPAAIHGGYIMRLWKDGIKLDERICHITERDEAARRLSLYADYVAIPGGMQVYATYHARESAGGGTRYALDCHSRIGIEVPADATRSDVATMIATFTKQADGALYDYLNSVKAKAEG